MIQHYSSCALNIRQRMGTQEEVDLATRQAYRAYCVEIISPASVPRRQDSATVRSKQYCYARVCTAALRCAALTCCNCRSSAFRGSGRIPGRCGLQCSRSPPASWAGCTGSSLPHVTSHKSQLMSHKPQLLRHKSQIIDPKLPSGRVSQLIRKPQTAHARGHKPVVPSQQLRMQREEGHGLHGGALTECG